MKSKIIKFSDIANHPTNRMDAKYWVNKPSIPQKILVINGLSESGKYSFYGNISMRWLETQKSSNTLLISNKGTKINDTLERYGNKDCFKEVMTFTEYFQEKSWKKAIKVLENKKFETLFDEIYLFTFFENLPTLDNLKKKIEEDDTYKHNFSQRLLEYRKYYLLDYLSKKLHIKHFVIDHLEQELNNSTRYHYYDTTNHKYSPFMMYSLFLGQTTREKSNLFNNKNCKDYDFLFGVTSFTYKGVKNWRDDFLREFLKIDFSDINAKIFITSPKLNKKEFIDKYHYDNMLRESKFTLVIPANNPNEFSITRFYEALTNDCIPLVLDTNQYEQAFTNDKQILKILKENLIVNNDNLVSKIKELDYTKVLFEIQNTEDYKKYQSLDYYKKYELC
jgi:hypothetical protein